MNSNCILLPEVEQRGVRITLDRHGFRNKNRDVVYPYVIMTLCTSGCGRALYDMQELTQSKNDLGLVMPGHIMHPLDCSDDYSFALIIISPKLMSEVLLDDDMVRFDKNPMCHLTDEQAARLLTLLDHLEYIANLSEEELPHRHRMLKAQLLVGFELLVHFRQKQDPEWSDSPTAVLYSQFCDLVVEHYTQSRNVNYYAELLGYDARYFSRVFRTISNGISPLEWIGRYVTTQAKVIMDAYPKQSIKETAYQLGFSSTANFCRYFKRVTGITPQEYKDMKKEP